MASIEKRLVVGLPLDRAWEAFADYHAVDKRLAPGFVTDCQPEPGGRIVTSPDGESWQENYVNNDSMFRMLYTGNLFVAFGNDENTGNAVITTSSDAVTWTTRFDVNMSGNGFFAAAQGGGAIIAILTGGTQQVTSVDGGLTWATASGPGFYNALTYSLGKFVGAGNAGVIKTSADAGATWVTANSGEVISFTGVNTGNGVTVAMGQGGVVVYSTDNVTFNRAIAMQTAGSLPLNKPFAALKAIDGQLYVGGGTGSAGGAVILRSSDGQTFTSTTVPGSANNITDFLKQGSSYYAVGLSGTILTSADSGATWTQVTSGTTINLNAIAYLNGKFVATGNQSKILTSPDGASGNWTTVSTPLGACRSLAWPMATGSMSRSVAATTPAARFAMC